MENILSYRNEDNKCYGATGMAIGIVVFDGEDMLSAISLDALPHEVVELNEEYFFAGNPGISAKSAWNRILGNYNLAVAMLIANVMCRRYVLDKNSISAELKRTIKNHIIDEGTSECALEVDEINRIFDKNYTYLHRVFSHSGVQSIAHNFADVLKRQRRLTRSEIIDNLRALSML